MMLGFSSALLTIAALSVMFYYRQHVLHPAFWTNAGFVGYAMGGIYYSIAGVESATFLDLARVEEGRNTWFLVAMGVVFAGFVCCNIGFYTGDR